MGQYSQYSPDRILRPNKSLTATSPVTPFVHWRDEVQAEASRLIGNLIDCDELGEMYRSGCDGRARLGLWWDSGEPVWMAAQTLARMCLATKYNELTGGTSPR